VLYTDYRATPTPGRPRIFCVYLDSFIQCGATTCVRADGAVMDANALN